MLHRSALQRQIDQLKEEVVDIERGRIRVTRRIDGYATWEDVTHLTLIRTRERIGVLEDAAQGLADER